MASLDDALREIMKLKGELEGNPRALESLGRIEEAFSDEEELALELLRRVVKRASREELSSLARRIKEDSDLERLIGALYAPPGRLASLVFWGWVFAAGVFFIMGLYLFFPPYVFFSEMGGNATVIQRTLEVIYTEPFVLKAADFIFKLLGLLMLVMALASMYQAHIIMERMGAGG